METPDYWHGQALPTVEQTKATEGKCVESMQIEYRGIDTREIVKSIIEVTDRAWKECGVKDG